MLVIDDVVRWSATDLTRATECEFRLLREVDVILRRVPPAAVPVDALMEKVAELGQVHEAAELARLRELYGDWDPATGRGVRQIEPVTPYTEVMLRKRQEETLAALKAGADVVYQATLYDGSFHGRADFLVRDEETGGYRVCDAKLARQERPKALLQLAAYAEQLDRNGIPLVYEAELLLGNGRRTRHPLAEIGPVLRERRVRLLAILAKHVAGEAPVQWDSGEVLACGRCEACAPEVVAHRDLLLVAGMRAAQRRTLLDAGVGSIDELATFTGPAPGMSGATFDKLKAQAALQVAQQTGPDGRALVDADVFAPEKLAGLPPPDDGDLFFDFEGDPMWNDGDVAHWGLEYLFGVTTVRPKGWTERFAPFHSWWADDRAQEKQALEDFVAFVEERRKTHPGLHVYHYAAYEKTALTRLAIRHSTCEDIIDDWLRQGLLVDLYTLVRRAVRVSQPSYSIKKLEPLYMGDDLRDGDVTDAAASIVEYHAYCTALDDSDGATADEKRASILDYNNYDCESTLRLRDWLLDRAAGRGVEPAGELEELKPAKVTAAETAALEEALRAGVPDTDRSDDEQARAMLAAAVGFNRREDKPFWWAYFERLQHPVVTWREERDVLVAEHAEVVTDWDLPAGKKSERRRVRLVGRWGAGTSGVPRDLSSVYEEVTEDAHWLPANSLLGIKASGTQVVATDVDDEGRDVVVVDELLPAEAARFTALPVALVPAGPVPAGRIDGAIRELAQRVVDGGLIAQPGLDVLRRRPPLAGDALPHTGDNVAAMVAALRVLDRSYLAVQGPPGTGKTWTGSKVIARLVLDHGWTVGVVAQGHTTVEHMLDGIVEAEVPAAQVAKVPKDAAAAHRWTVLKKDKQARFLADATGGCVIGGTAWDFAHEGRVARDQLDLLVIDEAGQFSLAFTLGASVAAQRLLLLGDPQQLPQVSQGTHAEPIDTSALGWLMGDHATLPPELGYFLETTWRMHPDLCAKDSVLSYDGRLRSNEPVTAARSLDGVEPGVRVVEVEHRGRSTESPEEADAVAATIASLVGATWHDPAGKDGPRPLVPGDVLVVAPYNAQVHLIRRTLEDHGLHGVEVGTVDKFQGKQAPVVIVSMTASAMSDVPRGVDFLLNRNRVNVAISRGQWLAVVVRSPELTRFIPTSTRSLEQLGAFIGLCEATP